MADTFFMDGYQEAGYEYIIIDDCWSEKVRDSAGKLVADKKRFPNGMKYIADYVSRSMSLNLFVSMLQETGKSGVIQRRILQQ